jgi:hypothetical protein
MRRRSSKGKERGGRNTIRHIVQLGCGERGGCDDGPNGDYDVACAGYGGDEWREKPVECEQEDGVVMHFEVAFD